MKDSAKKKRKKKRKKEKPRVSRIIVDEGVTYEDLQRFESFARGKSYWSDDHLRIRQAYPGMPDADILHHLLGKTTVLLTTDRPLHNTALKKGFRSWLVEKNSFRGISSKGVRLIPDNLLVVKADKPRDSYHPKGPRIRSLVIPDSERRLKRLRVKRRRIRSHFGGQQNLGRAAVTLSLTNIGQKALIGIRLKIAACIHDVKGLEASESYIEEAVPRERWDAAAHCHALILLLQLMLHELKVEVYFDADRMKAPAELSEEQRGAGYGELLDALGASVPDLNYIPTVKGPFIERLRRKLAAISRRRVNEIVRGDIEQIKEKVLGAE